MQTVDAVGTEKELLEEETRLREARRRLGELRRKLPPVEVPDYEFRRAGGGEVVRLSELFVDKPDLILIHNMGARCPGCTMWADELNGAVRHLQDRAAFAVVSNDPPQLQATVLEKRGWRFPLVSAHETSYSREAGFFDESRPEDPFKPGVTTYARRDDGRIYRIQLSPFGPGDEYCGAWNLVELLEGGAKGWFAKLAYVS